jgi:hypothetical protein
MQELLFHVNSQTQPSLAGSLLIPNFKIQNQLTTSELAFMCDKRDRSGFVGVTLVPFDGTFQSRRDEVPVLTMRLYDAPRGFARFDSQEKQRPQ